MDNGDAFTGRVFIAETTNPVRTNNQLGRNVDLKCCNTKVFTWTVLSNHRLPPLNLLPPPVNICLNISFMLLGTDRSVLFFRASNAGQHCLYVYECNNYFQSASFICIYLNPKPGLIRNILRFLIQTNQKEGGSNALQALNVDLP